MAIEDFNHIKVVLDELDSQRPARFGYTEAAVNATGEAEITALEGLFIIEDPTQINSIPTPDLVGMDPVIINIGLRAQAATISRMAVNHFFGRLGLNLLKVTEKLKLLVDEHLVNRYITPSGNVVENITVLHETDQIRLIQHQSPLSASAPVTTSAPITLLPAVYNGAAGVMTGADKKALDDLNGHTVMLTGAQTIAGVKTFSDIPVFNGGTSGVSAPFVVDSNTEIENLNASLLNGKNYAEIITFIMQELLYQKNSYLRDNFPKVKNSANRTVYCVPKYIVININGIIYSRVEDFNLELDLNQSTSWDSLSPNYTTAANRAGKDFYLYACQPVSGTTPVFILSANSTYPAGYTAINSRKIGGFHCLCTTIGSAVYSYYNEGKDVEYINSIFADGSLITNGSSAHWLNGWLQGDILPFSCWDLQHRPNSDSDAEGRVYNPKTRKWIMIYLASWSAGLLKSISVFGGAISSGNTSPAFHFYRWEQVLANQGESLLLEKDFVSASLGSPQGVNISGSANPVTTGGHISTDSKRIVSNIGCEDMTGVFWQWGNERGSNTTTAWANAYDGNDKNVAGQHYSETTAALFGGYWNSGAYCGSRGSSWLNSPLHLSVSCSGRAASEAYKD